MSTMQTPGGPDGDGLQNKSIKVYDRPDKAPGLSPMVIGVIVVVVLVVAAYFLFGHHAGLHA